MNPFTVFPFAASQQAGANLSGAAVGTERKKGRKSEAHWEQNKRKLSVSRVSTPRQQTAAGWTANEKNE